MSNFSSKVFFVKFGYKELVQLIMVFFTNRLLLLTELSVTTIHNCAELMNLTMVATSFPVSTRKPNSVENWTHQPTRREASAHQSAVVIEVVFTNVLGSEPFTKEKNLLLSTFQIACVTEQHYVSIFFTRLWSVRKPLLFDTQNPRISGFSAAHTYKYKTERQAE